MGKIQKPTSKILGSLENKSLFRLSQLSRYQLEGIVDLKILIVTKHNAIMCETQNV